MKATLASDQPMSIPAYVATIFAPSCLFMLLSLPVKRRNIIQEVILALLWFTELCIPIYYAGQFPYLCLMSTSVWSWASSMKMGVWTFTMSMEERRKEPFILTLLDWRKRSTITVSSEPTIRPRPNAYIDAPLGRFVWTIIKHQLAFDLIDFIFNYGNSERPIRVFSALVSKLLASLGQSTTAAELAPAEPLTFSAVTISTLMCMLFCVYIQVQLQVTFDTFMVFFALIYKILPTLEQWQLGENSKQLHTKNIAKTKAILKRLRYIRAVKSYIEETFVMPPPFDSPWKAHSLREFWGVRWHTYYNDCFYRLGYRPIRWVVQLVFDCKPPRWLPALSVFVMSGLMHEFFLYAATGSALYFGGPLPACGLQFLFFVIQVIGISIGDRFFSRGGRGKMYTVFCFAISAHLFVVPYILTGYQYMERFSFYRLAVNLYQGNQDMFASLS